MSAKKFTEKDYETLTKVVDMGHAEFIKTYTPIVMKRFTKLNLAEQFAFDIYQDMCQCHTTLSRFSFTEEINVTECEVGSC